MRYFGPRRTMFADGARSVVASGGSAVDLSVNGVLWRIHTFTSSGTLTFDTAAEIEYLVVAGGGGGGSRSTSAGGGGGGGFLFGKLNISVGAYSIVVGAGGAGGSDAGPERGSAGSNSSFAGLVAVGGGGGGGAAGTALSNGFPGGSGGGAGTASTGFGVGGFGASGLYTQGSNGGNAMFTDSTNRAGGGGGGATAQGQDGDAANRIGGLGGAGFTTSISGTSATYSAGGNGGAGVSGTPAAKDAPANTGRGGHADGSASILPGGNGGSGIVIVRYKIGTQDLPVPVAHYKLNDDAADTVVVDSGPNGLNGVSNRNTDLYSVAGKINTALEFNNVDDRVVINDAPALNISGPVSVSAWIKTNSAGNGDAVVAKGTSTTTQYILDLTTGTGGLATRFFGYDSGSAKGITGGASRTLVDTGEWVHCVGTFDGVSTWNTYANGVLAGAAATSAATLTPTSGALTIGSRGTGNHFGGTIDDVRIYNKVLTPEQVWQLYNLGQGTEESY